MMTTTLETNFAPTAERPAWLAAHSHGEMAAGSVLFHAPPAVFQAPGGGENQLLQTGRFLEDLGLTIRLFSSWTDRLEDARLLHLFGMSREGLSLAQVARARGIRVVLSPICWVEPRALVAEAPSRLQRCWAVAKWTIKRRLPHWPCWRRELLKAADAILPNSELEARQLVALFGANPAKLHVVPNGVQPRFASADPGLFHSRFGGRDFVLYVGRIEPRKNVLGLIEAIEPMHLPLVVIGDVAPGHEDYARACRSADHDFVRWVGGLDHDDPLLSSAYAAARVFALPSWFETPGLSALEAALAGCAVVITPFGCTQEYFGGRVEYARPDRPPQIRRAVLRAWVTGPDFRLAPHVQSKYLWSDVARRTAEIYDQLGV